MVKPMGKLLLLLTGYALLTSLSSCVSNVLLPPGVIPNQLLVIQPPFQKDKKFIISQGFHGKKSHTNEFNRYAVDLAMPDGEPVCSVMSGVVESFNDVDRPMSENERFREDNYVRILHADRSWGLYTHLTPGSVTVKARQKIKKGDCFAKVGNTGLSTGPHLHFALLEMKPDRFISIPFRFKQPKKDPQIPRYLQWVRN